MKWIAECGCVVAIRSHFIIWYYTVHEFCALLFPRLMFALLAGPRLEDFSAPSIAWNFLPHVEETASCSLYIYITEFCTSKLAED